MGAVPNTRDHGTIRRGPDSLQHAKDFHAHYPGTCGRCGEPYPAGAVLINSVRGYVHSPSCPRDLPPESGGGC